MPLIILPSYINIASSFTNTGPDGVWATWDPNRRSSVLVQLSNNDLTAGISPNTTLQYWESILATHGRASGKWYWEITGDISSHILGMALDTWNEKLRQPIRSSSSFGFNNSMEISGSMPGLVYALTPTGFSTRTTDVYGFALDMDAGNLYISRNGVWFNGANPGNKDDGWVVSKMVGTFRPAVSFGYTSTLTANFGQLPFKYTPPSGFIGIS